MSGGWLLRRIGLALLAAFGVGVLVFALLRLIPGDVVTQLIGLEGNVSAAQQAEMRRLFGLDQPIWVQFLGWFGSLLRGDFGVSLRTDRPVFTDLLLRFPVTLELSVLALIFAVLVGLPLGILAALRRGQAADLISSSFVLIGLAAPEFWLAILMILLFSLKLGWFPPNGYVLAGRVAARQPAQPLFTGAGPELRAGRRHHPDRAGQPAGRAVAGLHPHRPRQGADAAARW